MNEKPLVSCLTATYGRLFKLSEAVSCFLEQDYENKELIILNNHPSPIYCDFPQVKIYNEPIYPTLGDCRNRLLELANGEYLRTWDDDDLYLPWAVSQGIENIKNDAAWKPEKSWFWLKGKTPELAENVFEASITFRTDIVKKYGYLKSSGGNEHVTLCEGIEKDGGIKKTFLKPSYVYRWGWGMWHISGSLGNGTIESRTKTWYENNTDVQDGIIKLMDLKQYWDKLC